MKKRSHVLNNNKLKSWNQQSMHELAPRGQRPRSRRVSKRRGVAAVEFAILLPVVTLLVFGAIEASSFIFLKQALQVAAYEGIREAVRTSGTAADARVQAEAILASRQIRDAVIQFTAADPTTAQRGQSVVIEITAPTRSNSPLAGRWINNRTLSARLLMLKE
jgi:Flp pilus assembly protein TadG